MPPHPKPVNDMQKAFIRYFQLKRKSVFDRKFGFLVIFGFALDKKTMHFRQL
jgi:hypothetical protein